VNYIINFLSAIKLTLTCIIAPMNPTLYFLRSSEHTILIDLLHYATGKKEENPELNIYTKDFGYNTTDIGIYALVSGQIAGAVWIRLIGSEPTLLICVKPEYQNNGIGSMMINQIFLEAGAIYEQLMVDCSFNHKAVTFFERFDFKFINGTKMKKELIKKELKSPNDSYNPRRWMN